MEKDVNVNSTIYEDVEKVVLTDADNGGHALFIETSGATAEEEDVTAGETYYADGEEKTGTHQCRNTNNGDGNIYWKDIIDKPFESGKMFNDIIWDGNITDKVIGNIKIGARSIPVYKISDQIISKHHLIGSLYVYGISTNIIEKYINFRPTHSVTLKMKII